MKRQSQSLLAKRALSTVIVPLVGAACFSIASTASALTVVPTTSSAALSGALGGGGGLTVTSTTVNNGSALQFGTYSGFTSPPVTIGDGIVLSTGLVSEVVGPSSPANIPSTQMGSGGTPEFNAYGPGHITNFASSNDVASLSVNFNLATADQVGFDFVFGSVEYPQFVNNFTDSFVAFLDGTAITDQIVFDASNNAVQVGSTFAGALTTGDTNTSFANPHGLLKLTTFTQNALAAGNHTLTFEIGDTNDQNLDSGVFISGLHAGTGQGGTNPNIPEPSTLLFGVAMLGACLSRRAGRRVSA
jgi:hypothetical protein